MQFRRRRKLRGNHGSDLKLLGLCIKFPCVDVYPYDDHGIQTPGSGHHQGSDALQENPVAY